MHMDHASATGEAYVEVASPGFRDYAAGDLGWRLEISSYHRVWYGVLEIWAEAFRFLLVSEVQKQWRYLPGLKGRSGRLSTGLS